MDDRRKTKQQLIDELNTLREQVNRPHQYQGSSKGSRKMSLLAPEIIENAAYSIWACKDSSKNYEIVFWNRRAEEIYHTPREIAIGMNFCDNFVHPLEIKDARIDIDDIIHQGKEFRNFFAVDHTHEGENRLVLTNNFRVWDEDDDDYVQIEIALYVTETELLDASVKLKGIRTVELERIRELELEKKLHEEIRKLVAEKQEIATRTNIAIDFVHSINNLAGPIKTWTGLIRERLFLSDPRDEQINHYLEKIERETNRVLDEAEQLRLSPQVISVDLEQLLKAIETNIRFQYPEIKVQIHALNPNDKFKVTSAPSHLSVALWNVIYNSIEAIIQSGVGTSIDISLMKIMEGEKPLVEVSVTDDGPGIPIDAQEKIFDLGFSSKERDGLSGYGLWRSKDIINNAGGEISFVSEAGRGTRFKILLPAD